jgi:hypothetical protein
MTGVAHQKVNAGHLKRNAYLYVRQSTLRQVFENTESTKRQYGLRQHAVALGWPVERIIVIDSDLGQSGASAVDREGFQKLVSEVGLGKAGIVLDLEVSRLARNFTDWYGRFTRSALRPIERHVANRWFAGLVGNIRSYAITGVEHGLGRLSIVSPTCLRFASTRVENHCAGAWLG